MPRIELQDVPTGERSAQAAYTGTRPVYFGEVGTFVPSQVFVFETALSISTFTSISSCKRKSPTSSPISL